MTLKEWFQKKVLSFLGLVKYESTPGDDRLTFVNDEDTIIKTKLREYNAWYSGDSDELLNFYTRENTIGYNYEPWYDRNKRSYFWAISSTEEDIKRTHSGQARNIVDTLVAVVNKPDVQGGPASLKTDNKINDHIDHIIKENDFWKIYTQMQMPLTFVEGWGCYKINWDLDISDYPIIVYYKAEQVDFIYKSNRIVGIVFKDYYTDAKNKKYLLTETRSLRSKRLEDGSVQRNLHIVKEAFELAGEDDVVKPIKMSEVDQFRDMDEEIVIEDFNRLLAQPCVFYEDTNTPCYGRSIFTGKIDLFDDLDQCLSQSSNAVRRSTPVEYFDTNFLERDKKTGLPVQPKVYDRKFTFIAGTKGADGESGGKAVETTQPNLDFKKYSEQAIDILTQIVTGIMSPATLGIDISKRDNAEAQREKEKVTIFTRNMIIDTETDILKSLFSQALCAYECMHTGKITKKEYDMSINFSEFADDSFENKLTVLGDALSKKNLSPKMYMSRLYGHSLSESDYTAELTYLEEHLKQDDNPFGDGAVPPGTPGAEEDLEDDEKEQEPFN